MDDALARAAPDRTARGIRAVLGVLAAGALAACASSGPVPNPQTTSAVSGEQKGTGNYYFIDGNCQPLPFTVRIVEAPRNGEIVIRNSTRIVRPGANFGNIDACVGNEVASREVFYKSNPGFSGIDEFTMRIKSRFGQDLDRWVVTVR